MHVCFPRGKWKHNYWKTVNPDSVHTAGSQWQIQVFFATANPVNPTHVSSKRHRSFPSFPHPINILWFGSNNGNNKKHLVLSRFDLVHQNDNFAINESQISVMVYSSQRVSSGFVFTADIPMTCIIILSTCKDGLRYSVFQKKTKTEELFEKKPKSLKLRNPNLDRRIFRGNPEDRSFRSNRRLKILIGACGAGSNVSPTPSLAARKNAT